VKLESAVKGLFMKFLEFTYRIFNNTEPPRYLKKFTLLQLLWKIIRKFLNVSVIPFIPINAIRVILYRLIGYKIGKHCFIGMMCYLDDRHPDQILLEDNVVVAYRVTFAAHGKDGSKSSPIILKKGCYIGTGAIILMDVTIGEFAVVGAGAVVTKDVSSGMTVIGIPAKPISMKM
jgi:acetyltransferase-like isoleucine patch superfamily enzyme